MDSSLQALLSWQFLMFSIGIFTITWIIRTIVEYIFPKADGATFWEKLVLPIMPPTVGVIAALVAKAYPYPDSITTTSGRVFFGMVTGILSGLVYQVVKGSLADKVRSFLNTPTYPQPNYNPSGYNNNYNQPPNNYNQPPIPPIQSNPLPVSTIPGPSLPTVDNTGNKTP